MVSKPLTPGILIYGIVQVRCNLLEDPVSKALPPAKQVCLPRHDSSSSLGTKLCRQVHRRRVLEGPRGPDRQTLALSNTFYTS